jgi:hypothetical protein
MSGAATTDRQEPLASFKSEAATPIGIASTKIKPDVFTIQERTDND